MKLDAEQLKPHLPQFGSESRLTHAPLHSVVPDGQHKELLMQVSPEKQQVSPHSSPAGGQAQRPPMHSLTLLHGISQPPQLA
jgi:hypothetical protein